MQLILILLICVNLLSPVKAYEEQALQPVEMSPRLMPPKQKTYPVLEKLEKMLYPDKNFNSENPSKRLERLEIAVMGSVQTGTISQRLTKIQNETEAWQISNIAPKPNPTKPAPSVPGSVYQARPVPRYIQEPRSNHSYMSDRVMGSVIQNLSRRGINALF